MAITRERIAYFFKMALLFVAQGLLDKLISVSFFSVKAIRQVFANPVTNSSHISWGPMQVTKQLT